MEKNKITFSCSRYYCVKEVGVNELGQKDFICTSWFANSKGKYQLVSFDISDLNLTDPWNEHEPTKKIVFDGDRWKTAPIDSNNDEEEPKDNTSQKECYWCGRKTVTKQLLSTTYQYCEKCKK